jgi:Xaa-Pro aminopeptidase
MKYGLNNVDWEERWNPERMRKERLEKARQAMKRRGIDALLCFTPANIRYITGTRGITLPALHRHCLLIKDEAPLLFEFGGDLGRVKDNAPWLNDRIKIAVPSYLVTDEIAGEWAKDIKNILRQAGAEKIGIDSLSFKIEKALHSADIDYVDGNPVMSEARMIKTKDELECIKLSVSLAELAFEAARNAISPGIKEGEVQGEMVRILAGHGCDWVRGICAAGEHTNPYWRIFGTDKVLAKGDLVIIDRVHSFNGYACDHVRTFLCGDKATKGQKKAFLECHQKLYAAIDMIKPGNTTAQVAEKLDEKEDYSEITIKYGHGLGLDAHENPHITFLSKKHPVTIMANMVFAVETYVPDEEGKQGVRLEENLIVTDIGYEIISKYPFDERLLD